LQPAFEDDAMIKDVQRVETFARATKQHVVVIEELAKQQSLLLQIADCMCEAITKGNKILWCGNGGSAADCQHLAAELVGRFQRSRPGLASIALTTDTSILTAVANDFGYEHVFRRQVEALCRAGDVLIGISTSGTSPNVCAAVVSARALGARTVAMTGSTGGYLADNAEICLRICSDDPRRVQEAHIFVGHILCEWIESAILAADGSL
jgi:D-sedoheptulose 7-phosphate isomerase